MATITDYNQFAGTHWETGSIRNFLAARGFIAPHTGRPYSEAFLLGVSGGIVVVLQRIARLRTRVCLIARGEHPGATAVSRQLRQRDAQGLTEERVGADHRPQTRHGKEPRLHAR